jgi:hypothetical protein
VRLVRRVVGGLVVVAAALATFAGIGLVVSRLEAPRGAVWGPAPSHGLPSACSMAPDVVRRAVPGAVASRRTLTRHLAECTLTAGSRQLRIEVTRHAGPRADDSAEKDLAARRDLAARLTRRFQPPLQDVRGLGDQAYRSRLPVAGGAVSTLIARRGTLVVGVRYQAPPAPPRGATADARRYATVDAVTADVLRAVLAGL